LHSNSPLLSLQQIIHPAEKRISQGAKIGEKDSRYNFVELSVFEYE
ncbi:unnamed protein product, partial [marine sediment metagenome]